MVETLGRDHEETDGELGDGGQSTIKEVGMFRQLTLAIGVTFLNSRMRSTERATEQFINDAERR